MNDKNGSHDFVGKNNVAEPMVDNIIKKRRGLFSKKTNNPAKLSYKAAKPKKSLKSFFACIGRWIKRNKLVTLAIILLILLAIGAAIWHVKTQPKPRVLTANNQVITEYKSKLPELQKAANANNSNATAHKNYAVALYVTGNYEAAKNEYETVVKLDSKDATAYNNLGNTYRDLGRYDKAKTAYEKSFEINSTSINPYVNLANIQLYSQNDSNGAINTYKKALKAMPNNNQVSLLLGIAYEKAGKTTEAKQTYQDILSRDANDKAAKAGLNRLNK